MPLSRSLQAAQRRPGGPGPRVVPDFQPAARTLSEWSRIEAVPVGTRTEVQLHDDEAPPDSRRVMGRFHSATADTLTLTLDESSTRPLARDRPCISCLYSSSEVTWRAGAAALGAVLGWVVASVTAVGQEH